MNELDRALEIDPRHIDALSAKGTLLVKLPGLLGGDSEKGELLLQHVIKRAPKAVNARLALAKVRCEHGNHQEAVALAKTGNDGVQVLSGLKEGEEVVVAEINLKELRDTQQRMQEAMQGGGLAGGQMGGRRNTGAGGRTGAGGAAGGSRSGGGMGGSR